MKLPVKLFVSAGLSICLLAGLPSQVPAAAAESVDPVFVFNRICYAQVPDVGSIEKMAQKLTWRAMKPEDLNQATSIENPDVLLGWDAQVGERFFRVSVVQSKPIVSMLEKFPEFSKGKATSCTLVLDELYGADLIKANMRALAGKDPLSSDVPEDGFLVTTWAGGNADLKVFLLSKTSADGKGGLLNVTILEKGS